MLPLQEKLTIMLAELESSPLVTILAPCKRPCNEGGCIRVNMSVPPKWYRKLCASHTSSRAVRRGKHDTRIKRQSIIRILTRLSEGRYSSSKYADELLGIAKKL